MKKRQAISFFPLLIMCVFLVFASSCDKEDDDINQENAPVLSTTEVTEVTQTTATSGGNITNNGGATVTARGVCWSTSENPTIDDNKTEDGTGAGSFTSSIADLEPNTTYHVRAYATNSAGTGYGNPISFKTKARSTGSTFTDPRDDKVYQTVIIGNQEWMAENLAYAPSDGNFWAYDNDDSNLEIYGYLYDWETALNVCPTGWHLPSDEAWTELTDYLGDYAGGKLKATGTIETGTGLWDNPNEGANNETGFTALPGGHREIQGSFILIGNRGYWWSSTEFFTDFAFFRGLYSVHPDLWYNYLGKELGLSVRCVRD